MFRVPTPIRCLLVVCLSFVTVACSDNTPAATTKTGTKDAATTDSWVKLSDVKATDATPDVKLAELPGVDVATGCKANEECVGKVSGLQVCQIEACEKATGKCIATMASDGTACDGTTNLCVVAPTTCQAGICSGKAVLCDDTNPCTDDSCDPAAGCMHVNNTALCDDGDACTTGDSCSDGKCHGGSNSCTGKETNCGNGIDDDKDGATDCQDNDCSASDLCKVTGPETICNDKIDNDNDGKTDCDDTDCAKDPACAVLVPTTETLCADQIDNDKDGMTDCADNDCAADAACATPLKETLCADGIDNDKDGKTDCADADCTADAACKKSNVETICNDKIDNDQDGATDCADNDCMADLACAVTPETNCTDKIDNDGDGKTDCDDSDCAKTAACKVVETLCADKIDNDKDGFTDCDDSDCAADAACATKCVHDLCTAGAKVAKTCDACATAVCAQDSYCCSTSWDSNCVSEIAQYCTKQCPVPVETNCTDKVDNDKDGMTDCADTDCAADPACKTALCVPDYPFACGGTDNFNNSGTASTNQIDGYTCADGTTNGETGNEYTYDFTSECDGPMTITLLKQGTATGFLDLYILDGSKSCASASCLGHGLMSGNTATKTLDAKKGQKFFVVIDGYAGYSADFTIKATCGCAAGKETACADGIDNDVDGKTDCADKDCAKDLACAPTTETSCTDKIDNDKDGQTDCADSDCAKDPACSSTVEKICNDKIDNDKDGMTDCADSDCAQDLACAPTVETDCGDGIDNDKDGKTDCADSDCSGKAACVCAATESLACGGNSSWSNSGQGSTKAVDAYTCTDNPGYTIKNETGSEYSYSYTADCDGTLTVSLTKTSAAAGYLDLFLLDGAKACGGNTCTAHALMNAAGTASKAVPVTKGQQLFITVDGYQGFSGNYAIKAACDCALPTPATETNCSDKIDNDKDGKTDCADSDCAADAACKVGAETICNDGIDNDKNGKTDCADPACATDPACTCQEDFAMTCGASDSFTNSGAGSSKAIDAYTCADGSAVNETGSEYVYAYVGECDGDVTVTLTKTATTTGYLDLFLLDGAKTCGGDACLAHSLMGGKTATLTFTAKKGAKYGIAVDGYAGYSGAYTIKTTCGCAPATETNCTNAIDDDKDGLTDCADSDCAGDAACQTASNCMPDTGLDCGYVSKYSTSSTDATNAITSYTCTDAAAAITGETGHEEAYTFVPSCNGTATVTLTQPSNAAGDLDLFILDGTKACGGSTCVAHALALGSKTATKTFTVTKGQKFDLVVDGFNKYNGSYTLDAACSCQ